ncbi:MAG: hypothetical protein EP346_07460 [Bacteroidetes bacterium]|uniref:LPP20 lipoprotein n=1 Tax=Phaeocystidibacter marisrubri TaxID=1577780 RepID=A0A6L3ZHI5_9FLAO|nr:LPP20 family lipoprotein [Phaeocystidibacter marisrubri]KAB2817099.1 hypothetical protein F8C82_01495 [Phaeocystidibacter marisrubri]TNE29040.1 MAG: hypothetical protein EP346_07460 [Bacteroidota bacterium]GGH76867.1 hypothetical protein GCM10011318_25780 [Phaeocystidibacter marisrubri]
MPLSIKSFALTALTLLLFASCGSKKEISNGQPKPEWVQSKPIDPFYYIGIGVSPIQADGSHLQRAKSNALSDLSSEISVEISATSLLYQMEQNQRFREEFRAQTELNSLETVDGYELVGSYEADGYYWIQYRLDKASYASQRAARKQTAVDRAKSYYDLALESRKAHKIQESLTHTLTALAELKLYLNEPISANGVDGDFGIRLYTFVNELVSEIQIKPMMERVTIVRYDAQAEQSWFFETTTKDGSPLENIPVYLYYTGGFLRENQVRSDALGRIFTSLPKAETNAEHERLEADINFVAIAESATRDPLLRMLLTRQFGDRAEIKVDVRAPAVYMESDERIESNPLPNPPIEQSLRSFLLSNQFTTTPYKEHADLWIEIHAVATAYGTRDQMHLSRLSGEIVVKDKTGRLLRSFPLSSFQGVQLSEQLAGQDAYRRAIRELEDHEFRKLLIQ